MSEKSLNTDALMIAVAEVTSVSRLVYADFLSASKTFGPCTKHLLQALTDCPSKPPTSRSVTTDFKPYREPSPEAPRATISEMDDPDLDQLLKQLNIR